MWTMGRRQLWNPGDCAVGDNRIGFVYCKGASYILTRFWGGAATSTITMVYHPAFEENTGKWPGTALWNWPSGAQPCSQATEGDFGYQISYAATAAGGMWLPLPSDRMLLRFTIGTLATGTGFRLAIYPIYEVARDSAVIDEVKFGYPV